MKAADYSYSRPRPADLTAAGYTHVLRYLSNEAAKNVTPSERDALHAAGLALGLVWETTANHTLGGFNTGRADAIEANRQADALGFPHDRALYYAVDFDATAGQISGPITSYFQGAVSAGGRPVGCYGSYFVIEGIVGASIVGCGWQCAAWSGLGNGSGGSIDGRRLSVHACLFQHATQDFGGAVDRNTVLADPAPWAWHPNQNAPHHEEDDMINWRPVHCPEPPPVGTGNAQWMTTFDGDGRPRRLFLGPGDPQMYWALGYLQTIDPIVWEGDAAHKYLTLPEAVPSNLDALRAEIEALVRQEHGDIDPEALARYVAQALAERLAS